MSRPFSIPVNLKPVSLFAPKTTNAALTSAVVSLKGAAKAFAVFKFTQAAGFASDPTLIQATSIAGSTNKAGPACPIWVNEDLAASDTLVKQATDAAHFAVAADIKLKMVVFEIDPARFDVNGGYDCLYFTIGTSSQATNFVSADLYVLPSYQQATPPSNVVD